MNPQEFTTEEVQPETIGRVENGRVVLDENFLAQESQEPVNFSQHFKALTEMFNTVLDEMESQYQNQLTDKDGEYQKFASEVEENNKKQTLNQKKKEEEQVKKSAEKDYEYKTTLKDKDKEISELKKLLLKKEKEVKELFKQVKEALAAEDNAEE